MKTNIFRKSLAVLAVAGLSVCDGSALAQGTPASQTASATNASAVPQLPYGVSQVVQLTQAKVGDDTVIAFVKNSNNSYGLDAGQIIYLRQQGVSEAVITAMLNQPKPGVAAVSTPPPAAPTPAPSTAQDTATTASSSATYDSSTATAVPTATVAPTVTYVQTVPTYYYPPAYYYGYPYPYAYGFYPGISIGFGYRGGWGGGWHGGGGFHGGGGWHH